MKRKIDLDICRSAALDLIPYVQFSGLPLSIKSLNEGGGTIYILDAYTGSLCCSFSVAVSLLQFSCCSLSFCTYAHTSVTESCGTLYILNAYAGTLCYNLSVAVSLLQSLCCSLSVAVSKRVRRFTLLQSLSSSLSVAVFVSVYTHTRDSTKAVVPSTL